MHDEDWLSTQRFLKNLGFARFRRFLINGEILWNIVSNFTYICNSTVEPTFSSYYFTNYQNYSVCVCVYIYIYNNVQKVNNVIEGKNILFISPLHLMMLHASLYFITFFLLNQRAGIILEIKRSDKQVIIRMIKCFTWWKLKFLVNLVWLLMTCTMGPEISLNTQERPSSPLP